MAIRYIPHDGPAITRADAKATGQTRFFTGKPCKHGHLSQRTTANGGCIQCNAETANALYHAETTQQRKSRQAKDKAWKDNHRDQVREAGRAYSKANRDKSYAWKAANHDKVLEWSRDYYQRNRESILAKAAEKYAADPSLFKARYVANADAIKARVNAYRLARPDETRAAKEAWYAANKEVVKQRVREWNSANPEATRCRGRNYRARFRGAEGSHTGGDIKALFVQQRGRCIYCNVKLGKGYHVDHVVPLIKGGSNWPSNLQLTCDKCNNHKRATDPLEFARRLGRLV
jgi:5-methylcytosine-specific restriction endonuclease McrA